MECCELNVTERYYVYEHVRKDSGAVFYIGKGTLSKRYGFPRSVETGNRSKFWKRIVAKAGGFEANVIAVCATESLTFRLERALIAMHGRRLDGGTLCNLTLGGEGHSGLPASVSARRKLSLAFSGSKHPNWGKKLSAETCRKKSESLKASAKNLRGKKLPLWWRENIRAAKLGARNPMFGKTGERHHLSRKVRVRETGEIYPSVTAAAKALGWSMQGLHNMLTGFRPNTANVEFA